MSSALVTGAASGIGAACAAALREAGLAVAGLDLARARACDLAVQVDVTEAAAVEAAAAETEARLGPLRAVVTAAGYYEQAPAGLIGEDRWRRMLQVHVLGTVNACRAGYSRLVARGEGRICTIGSELALIGDTDAVHYSAAKGAIHGFTKALALEAAPRGIRVNCVAPGPTDTPLMTPALRSPAYLASLPLGRLVDPREVAETVRFLVMERHNLVGQVISPNAGAAICRT